ncbi:hypothetical protein BH10ACT11_BH10ACT11_17580 [soil metagenome]
MARLVINQLIEAADDSGAALVVATHDSEIAERIDLRWEMGSGELESPTLVGGSAR